MTSPTFGRREAREVVARRARRHAAIRNAVVAVAIGFVLLLVSAVTLAIGQPGLSILSAIAAIGSFFMVSIFIGDA